MRLYFLRHADAEERQVGQSDETRKLSAKGRKHAAALAEWVRDRSLPLGLIVSSPRLRAVETAEPVAQALGLPVQVDERLSGGRLTVASLAELVADLGRPDSLLLVGHEPDFSEVIGDLVGGAVNVKKASLALVTCDHVAVAVGVLEWLVPAALRH